MINTPKHQIKTDPEAGYHVFRLVRNNQGEIIQEVRVGHFLQLEHAVKKLVEQLKQSNG